MGTISLSTLLDLAVNHTYRDFQILTELLKKKSEMDRKISIANFAHSTRSIYLRLLALVRWLKEENELEKLDSICKFLDQQSDYFVETADSLALVSQQELLTARLPLFQVSNAIDILSLGAFPQLPESSKTSFIQEPPLSKEEKKLTLQWMNNAINYRLIQESAYISDGFERVKVKNGLGIFTAIDKFNVYMILKAADGKPEDFNGDAELAKWRWCVKKVEILVVDYEAGFGPTVQHSSHNVQLTELCNQRLKHAIDDLKIIYEVPHTFVLNLQLDIVFRQALYMSQAISDRHVVVKVYDAQKGQLHVEYWPQGKLPLSTSYQISIERDGVEPTSRLNVSHDPPNDSELPVLIIQKRYPDFHFLFNETLRIRYRPILAKLREAI